MLNVTKKHKSCFFNPRSINNVFLTLTHFTGFQAVPKRSLYLPPLASHSSLNNNSSPGSYNTTYSPIIPNVTKKHKLCFFNPKSINNAFLTLIHFTGFQAVPKRPLSSHHLPHIHHLNEKPSPESYNTTYSPIMLNVTKKHKSCFFHPKSINNAFLTLTHFTGFQACTKTPFLAATTILTLFASIITHLQNPTTQHTYQLSTQCN